jgi:hypothetical protein
MRVGVAIAVATAIVVAKAGLTWVALSAWGSLPERPNFVGHLRIQLGTLSEWLAAIFTAVAVAAALWIATRDRHERREEREEEDKTHARLVRLKAGPSVTGFPFMYVEVRNYGPLPILDVELVSATWADHPEAHWGTSGRSREGTYHPILRPLQDDDDQTRVISHNIWFMHPTEDKTLQEVVEGKRPDGLTRYAPIDLSRVIVKIQFTTANGVHWETPTSGQTTGDPHRLRSRTITPA